ncbi:MAG TPA: LuxR C-terminal-related transcriptional regulator [Nocardioides sp.]|nr:LuxR C-terminal-related transcriptional regulator [Nocardioides sp.]
MSVAGPVWVLSPHLLVAQAVTAALRSVGVPAETRRWESVVDDDVSGASAPARPAVVVAIVDGVDNSTVVRHVEALAQPGDVRVVVVSSADASTRWGGLLANDAVDVVTVTTSVSQLADVVQRLTSGASSMDPEERLALRASWALDRDRRRHVREQLDSLSPQQRRVLELLASGHRVAEVGVEMGVAEGTVRSHVKALRAKLGASTQLKAVALFHQAYDVTGGADLVPRPRGAGEDPGDDPGHNRTRNRRGERVGAGRR